MSERMTGWEAMGRASFDAQTIKEDHEEIMALRQGLAEHEEIMALRHRVAELEADLSEWKQSARAEAEEHTETRRRVAELAAKAAKLRSLYLGWDCHCCACIGDVDKLAKLAGFDPGPPEEAVFPGKDSVS